jgi:putative peptide zinc metalloprotease protein
MTTSIRNIYRARLRMRPDLICQEQRTGSHNAWLVKDPISLRYFTLSPQEFAILNWLDGENSLHDICREFAATFPPQRITPAHLQSFFANLYENGLVVAESPDQGSVLLENRTKQQRRERLQTWLNFLAIRLPLFDPDRLLVWLEPKVRWMFSRTYLVLCALFGLFALGFVAYHATEFAAQLPELKDLLTPQNLLWMTVAFAVAKVLHEFGHALACKHFGGECHEMGIMLLLFVPCMYCNVTDSWMLAGRWRRIAVSAGGMIVEFQLAALGVFVWWFSHLGIIHAIALNTMIVCTVGTLFFNGNPLLRYDGYFILVDFLGIPNLWQESRSALKTALGKWFLKPEAVPPTEQHERRGVLLTYALFSIAYRIFVMLAILLFLQRVFVPKGLGVFIPIVLVTLAASAAVYWFVSLRRFWSRPMAWRQFRLLRLLYVTVAFLGVGCLLFALPLPCRISAPALLQPIGAQRVYVSTPGVLTRCIAQGKTVTANQELAQLDDVELRRDIVRLKGELGMARARVDGLQARLNDEPTAAAQLEVAQQMVLDLEHQLQQRQKDAKALTLTATVAGTVMEPAEVPLSSSEGERLSKWSGTPLDKKNTQCFLERGTLLCVVGNPAAQEAELFIDENDVRYVRPGQRVRMKFALAPSIILTGKIVEIAKRNIATVPRELAIDQELPNRIDATTGSRRPTGTSYSVRVSLNNEGKIPLLAAARGEAKILVEPQSLAERLLRSIRRTFTVDL